jgi:uncharacterized membrane protein (DUF4010 family)
VIATLFLNPLQIPSSLALWLVIPLCAAVAVVYKAMRVQDVHRLARETAGLILYMLGALAVLGAGLWALVKYWPR